MDWKKKEFDIAKQTRKEALLALNVLVLECDADAMGHVDLKNVFCKKKKKKTKPKTQKRFSPCTTFPKRPRCVNGFWPNANTSLKSSVWTVGIVPKRRHTSFTISAGMVTPVSERAQTISNQKKKKKKNDTNDKK